MNAAILSLLAVVVAIGLGYFRRVNTGVMAIALAWIVGRFAGGMTEAQIIEGWPFRLFFILLGITFFFSMASVNGTLRVITSKATYCMGGRRRLIPPVFFVLATVLSAIGPGNIAACAIILPLAMAVAPEEKISPLLIAAMVIGGANAGGLSPIAPTGIVASELATQAGLDVPRLEWNVFADQLVGQGLLALAIYVLLKGYALETRADGKEPPPPLEPKQWLTLAVIGGFVLAIVFGGVNIGLAAFAGTAILLVLGAADQDQTIRAIPWSPIILVCGVALLVNVCTETGGIRLLTTFLARFMSEGSVAPIMAVTGGLMSLVSSASGVVMPTLIPTVAQLVEEVGGHPTDIISSIALGSHVVTLSPFSTLGAIAFASAGKGIDKEKLFGQMIVLAIAALCYVPIISWLGII